MHWATERLAGARGKIFWGGPISKIFQEKKFFGEQPLPPSPAVDNFLGKTFPDEDVAIAFQRLYLNFSDSDQISVLCPKKTNILPFARKYLTQKNYWGPTKNFQGPPGPGGPGQFTPLLPPSRRSCKVVQDVSPDGGVCCSL